MKRILSFFLAMTLCVSMLPGKTWAEEAEESAGFEETVETLAPTETYEVTEEPGEEPAEEPGEESTEETPEEPADAAEEPTESMPTYMLSVTEEPEDTLLLEGMAFFYVSAAVRNGDALTEHIPAYQWQKWEENTWVDLSEQTNQVLTLEGLTEEAVGSLYRCRVTWDTLETFSDSAAITGLVPEEEPKETGETGTVVYINPLYEDVLTEEDLPKLSSVATYAEDTTRYESEEAFSAAIKQALLNREPNISGEVTLPSGYVPAAATFMRSLYFRAVAHTGVPTEGDYLRFEFGGYKGLYSFEEKTGVFRCTYNFLYYTTADQEEELTARVQSVLAGLDLAEKTDKEKIDAIYAYLCTRVKYDYANLNNKEYTLKYTAYAALCQGTAVCQGYATAFYRLCLESGIDARVISCVDMNHAWNIVNMGRFYYFLDATWDANHPNSYLYYLKGRDYWLKNHKSNGKSYLGDEFSDAAFSENYPVPLEDHGEAGNNYRLLEDGTLVLGEAYSEKVPDYQGGMLNGVVTTAAPWREVAEQIRRIQFPTGDSFCSIGQNAFRGLPNLEEVVIPETVGSIGSNAFRDCKKLTKLTILSGPETGADVFTGCPIETLSVPGEWYAGPLSGCLENLKALTLTDGGYMASYTQSSPAPWSGTGVETVTIDPQIQKISNYAFANCQHVTALTLPRDLRYIGTAAFTGCTGLTALELPRKLTRIYSNAFRNCGNLRMLTFTGTSLPTLDSKLFSGLTLTCIYPCTWQTAPTGSYGGTVTWKGNHQPTQVAGYPVTQTEDGLLDHWKCDICGRLYKEEGCETELSQEDVVLYRETYGIIYIDLEDGENPNPDTYASARGLTLKNASRRGYLFGGWYGEDGKKVTAIAKGTHGDLTLTAKWTAISYTLSFNANGGSGSASRRTLSYDADTDLPAAGFKRTGYTLSGWNTAKDGTGISYGLGAAVRNLTETNKAALTLYAQWEPISYTLVLDPNDGETEPNTVDLRYGDAYALPIDEGSRAGYHISAWTTQENGRGKSYTAGKSIQNLTAEDGAKITLYGRWTVNTYTVLFHSNSEASRERKQTFTYGKTAALAGNSFSRTGYVFSGWSTAEDGEAVYNNKAKVTNLTEVHQGVVDLYAVWKPISYKIVFKPNGASGEMDGMELDYGQEKSLPDMAYDRPGFTFLGWSTSSSGKVLYRDGQTVKNLTSTQGRTVTLYARWQAHSYAIQFHGGDGTTGTTRAMTKLSCGKTYTLMANGFKKPGYDFVGWVDTEGKTYANRQKGSNFLIKDGGTLDLYARWAPHSYTITYKNCIADDENPNPPAFTVEDTVTLADPRRPGCEFLGWYLDSGCRKPVSEIPAGSRTANLTVYAKWGNKGRGYEYAIAFDGNGATSGRMNAQTKRYNGTMYTLPSNGFKRSGHTFLGWSLDPEATTPTWTNRAKVGNLASGNGQIVTLYAVWR